ncbi:MAG: hypothetical protein GWO08_06830, partial [Gammaproteobacteria bacterium]|nr:hypothetical protein [Gammaproteobacteria bacterium]NIR93383.1 hypothetical protein [Gammaproteobacteria bacterium]NIW44968.1 hypothetical protein [Gammaproteobacteria bacterium]
YSRYRYVSLLLLSLLTVSSNAWSERVQTPYQSQKVLFDFYFDAPQKINSGLYWIRSLLNPLMAAPYNTTPEEHNIIVLIHGTE